MILLVQQASSRNDVVAELAGAVLGASELCRVIGLLDWAAPLRLRSPLGCWTVESASLGGSQSGRDDFSWAETLDGPRSFGVFPPHLNEIHSQNNSKASLSSKVEVDHDKSHVLKFNSVQVREDLSYEVSFKD
ncbi:hypothetical protein CR513_17943, partial [Mucuna pruriens]